MKVAIDGPAGAGKSSVALAVAKRFGFYYLDTGAMYRTLTLKTLQENEDPEREEVVAQIARSLDLTIEEDSRGQSRIFLDGEDVTEEIRSSRVNKHVSIVAKHPAARKEMVALQRKIGSRCDNVIMDGRDIGSVVMPDANFKFFLDASVEERAKRRWLERKDKQDDTNLSLDQVKEEINNRDYIDSNREEAPLIVPPDAWYIDTTDLTYEEVVDKVYSIILAGKKQV